MKGRRSDRTHAKGNRWRKEGSGRPAPPGSGLLAALARLWLPAARK